jgi:flagellar motility protein MotE (MotC chaperone)
LSSEQAGLIMANMESQQAYIVSVRLASLNEDLRREES